MQLRSDGKVEAVEINPEFLDDISVEPSESIEVTSDVLRNHLFLSVRPDWRDGKALIGYHNPLSGEYQRTQFLDFVIAAGDDYTAGNRNAFFVILDEMNLAHVEYYFADVLSVIESGRDEEGWTVEGISLSIGEADADLPETLKLPPNLYIVGTVNMDETTHPFSPKVLDRAFTIELTEVDFIGYPPEKSKASESGDDDRQALLRTFTQNGRYPRIDKGDIRKVVDRPERFGVDLQSLNLSLRRSRMHFGYRVFDEIMQFVFNAEENGLFTLDEAFDHAVLMKVLPKFNGSRAKLQAALFELLHWCKTSGTMSSDDRADLEARFAKLTDDHTSFDTVVPKDLEAVEDQWRYPATGRRAALMMQDLYTDGFAAFG
jgi:5-methylcytosine-specific restriction endonuclease McrBC GTP-binding regulatory subunit McrB